MFRFGIEVMQKQLLMEMAAPILARQEGFVPPSDWPPADVATLVERIASYGFKLIELNPDLNIFFPNSFNVPAVRRLRELKDSLRLSYTVHLPLWSLEPASPVEWVRRAAVEAMVDAVLSLSALEPEVYVLHATGSLATEFFISDTIPPEARPVMMAGFQRYAARSIEELLNRTQLPPRAIAIETIQFPLDLTLALAEEFDLSVCFDTGHVFSRQPGPVDFDETLQKCLPRLAEVHLHDAWYRPQPNGPARWADHLPLGEGEIPLESFLKTIRDAGFNGPVVFELTIQEALQSLKVIQGKG